MHTLIGQRALNGFMRSRCTNGMTKDQVRTLWFYMESAFINPYLANLSGPKKEPLPWDTIWWPVALANAIRFGGRTAKEIFRLWHGPMKRKMEEMVLWSMEKG
jgi:hypothetical protein